MGHSLFRVSDCLQPGITLESCLDTVRLIQAGKSGAAVLATSVEVLWPGWSITIQDVSMDVSGKVLCQHALLFPMYRKFGEMTRKCSPVLQEPPR